MSQSCRLWVEFHKLIYPDIVFNGQIRSYTFLGVFEVECFLYFDTLLNMNYNVFQIYVFRTEGHFIFYISNLKKIDMGLKTRTGGNENLIINSQRPLSLSYEIILTEKVSRQKKIRRQHYHVENHFQVKVETLVMLKQSLD